MDTTERALDIADGLVTKLEIALAENALLKRKLEIALRFIKEMQLNSFHVQADKVMTEIEEVK